MVIKRAHANVSPLPVADAVLAVDVISPDSHFRDMYATAKVYAAAGFAHYWVIDPLDENGIVLTEFGPGENGTYEILGSTDKVFVATAPYPVTIDLPALTTRRLATLEHARLKD